MFNLPATSLLIVGALLWLGRQWARQDRELAEKHRKERQETAADLCAAASQQEPSQAGARLANLATLATVELPVVPITGIPSEQLVQIDQCPILKADCLQPQLASCRQRNDLTDRICCYSSCK